MKSILFRSFGVSLLLLSLTFFTIADDGDMGTGSRSDLGNGGGSAPISEVNEINVDQTLTIESNRSESDYINWFMQFFSEIVS